MRPTPTSPNSGFSLSEVTLTIGIIATVLLPLIGLLGTSSQMNQASRDDLESSRLAQQIESNLHFQNQQIHFQTNLSHSLSIRPPANGKTAQVILLFEQDHTFLSQEDEATYSQGASPTFNTAAYIVRLSIEAIAMPAIDTPLFQISALIEHPASAPQDKRKKNHVSFLLSES